MFTFFYKNGVLLAVNVTEGACELLVLSVVVDWEVGLEALTILETFKVGTYLPMFRFDLEDDEPRKWGILTFSLTAVTGWALFET